MAERVATESLTDRIVDQTVGKNRADSRGWEAVRRRHLDVYGADWNAVKNIACPQTTSVRITAPGGGPTFQLRLKLPYCFSTFYVAPLIAGRVDLRAWSEIWHR
jgi:hypothetical protein